MATTNVLENAFKQVVSVLGEGASKDKKALATLYLRNAELQLAAKENEAEKKQTSKKVDDYLIAVNNRMDSAVADISTTTIMVTLTGGGLGFLVGAAAPQYFTNYPGMAKAAPYVVGGLIAAGAYLLTEPGDLERAQGAKPDMATRFNGLGFGVGMMGGAGLAQVGTAVVTQILSQAQAQEAKA